MSSSKLANCKRRTTCPGRRRRPVLRNSVASHVVGAVIVLTVVALPVLLSAW